MDAEIILRFSNDESEEYRSYVLEAYNVLVMMPYCKNCSVYKVKDKD